MIAFAIYHFICCVDLTIKMLLNNNNNNNNNTHNNNSNNNNNKDLFVSSIFTMALRAIEKKNYKNEQKC